MSSGKVHQSAGVIAGIVAVVVSYLFLNYYPSVPERIPTYPLNSIWFYWPFCIPISMLYSLLPDMDIKSKGSKLFYLIILGISGYLVYMKELQTAVILLVCSLVPQLFAHRKFTHSVWFAVIFPAPVYLIFQHFNLSNEYFIIFYISALAGYFSHILLDI